ncbi:hypothetical protein GCK32_006545, partial [Trichostrongylus colubriformis]
MYVSAQKGYMLVLGTNALQALHYELVQRTDTEAEKDKDLEKMPPGVIEESTDIATVCKRTYVAPGQLKWIPIKGQAGERILHSRSKWISSGLCVVNEHGEAEVPVWNMSAKPLVLRVNQEVGDWEEGEAEYSKVRAREVETDMLALVRGLKLIQDEVRDHNERYRNKMKKYYDNKNEVDKHYKPKVGERVFMRMPREKMVAAHPKLAFDWSGPFRVLECSDNSALITSVTAEEEPIRVQFDLLLKCPSEINDEPVKVFSKRKRMRRKESMCGACRVQIVMNENTRFRVEDEYEVSDSMHFLHVQFRCDGQPFPAIEGRAGFQLNSCRCSRSTYVKDLLPDIPPPAVDERVECVLDAARVLSIWWDVGSISLKVQRIMDRSYKVLKPKAVGFAYAFFRHRCLHVAIMAGSVPQGAPFRHTSLFDWICDSTRIIEYGWRIAKQVEWPQVALTEQSGQEHNRIVLVIPEVLHRIKHCLMGPNTIVFYYKSFRDVKATSTALFADDVGNVVYVLPPKEPTDPFSWLQFVNSLNLWLTCG